MAKRPLYPHGRLSVPASRPEDNLPQLSPELLARLRAVRTEGDEAMFAVEKYDPDFSIKLASCKTETEADDLLEQWLERRTAALKNVQAKLRSVWREASKHAPGRTEH